MVLIATDFPPSYTPAQRSEKPPDKGESPNLSILDLGMMYELGRMAYSPQTSTSPRKHRLLVRRPIWQWGSNICGFLVGNTNHWVEDDPYLPFQVLRQFSGPHPPPTVTLPLAESDPPPRRGSAEDRMWSGVRRLIPLA